MDDTGRVLPVLLPGQRVFPVQGLRQGRQNGRQGRKAVAEGDEIPRGGPVDRHARGKALQVIDVLQGFPQQGPAVVIIVQQGHGVLHGQDGGRFAPRMPQHVFQQAAAHGRHGIVQHMTQGPLALAAVEALEDLQIAFRHVVHQHVTAQVQRLEGHQMLGAAFLGLLQIDQQRAAGPHEAGLVLQAQGCQFLHGLGFQQTAFGLAGVETGHGATQQAHAFQQAFGRQFLVIRHQQLARGQLLDPLPKLGQTLHLHAGPLARGDVRPDEGPVVSLPESGSQIIVAAGVQVGVFQYGAGRHHAGHGPLHEPLGGLGVFGLVADGHMEALVDELGDVGLCGMPGHTAHGHGVFRVPAAAGQGDLQFPGRGDGIVEEKLVKVAHPVEQQRIRVVGLDAQILLEHGSQLGSFFCHMRNCAAAPSKDDAAAEKCA